MGSKRERSSEAPGVSRALWSGSLHRKTVRWDVLFHRLAEAIARRYWYMQGSFQNATLRMSGDQLAEVAIIMSKAFAKQTSLAGISALAGDKQLSLFDLTPETLPELARQALREIMRGLLNVVEIAHNCFLMRNHPDLDALRDRLEETITRFLKDKCLPGGELHPCLEQPLGDDEGYFPPNHQPADPDMPSGNPRLDAYRLNVLIHDGDDAARIKLQILCFARCDPFIGPDFVAEILLKLSAAETHAQRTGQHINQEMETIRLRDRFLFTPCRQRGLQPVELFLEQQVLASDRQKQRLRQWADQNVEGLFRVVSRDISTFILEDIGTGKTASVVVEDHSKFPVQPGQILRSRIVPWDDHWLFSGVQQLITVHDESGLEILKRQLHPLRLHRKVDNDDPRLLAAGRLTAFIHDRFVARFGHEVAQFDDLQGCRTALAAFHDELTHQTPMDDGRPFVDVWKADVGMDFPPFFADQFASQDKDTASPAIIYDRTEGMAFVGNFQAIAKAMTTPAPQAADKLAIRRLLLETWMPGWLVKRILMEKPAQAERLLRDILGGSSFNIEQNLEPLLGRLKCPEYTLPQRPTPFLSS